MNPDLWKCPKCGEEIEAQFDACWSCGTSKDGPAVDSARESSHAVDEIASPESSHEENEIASTEKILSEMLHLQKEQKQTLSDIQSRVGCLYLYMIVGIVLGVLGALIILSFL